MLATVKKDFLYCSGKKSVRLKHVATGQSAYHSHRWGGRGICTVCIMFVVGFYLLYLVDGVVRREPFCPNSGALFFDHPELPEKNLFFGLTPQVSNSTILVLRCDFLVSNNDVTTYPVLQIILQKGYSANGISKVERQFS